MAKRSALQSILDTLERQHGALAPPPLRGPFEKKSYAATYRLVQEAAQRELVTEVEVLQRAHLLLRRHGQELCRRTAPRCPACPAVRTCAFARSRLPGRP